MAKRVKSKDVLDANVVTKAPIKGEVIGTYRSSGPNSWDDWELDHDEDGAIIDIPTGNTLHLEPLGADPVLKLRFRRGRSVARLQWMPDDDDATNIESGQWGIQESEQATLFEKIFGLAPHDDPRDDMLEYFLDRKVDPYQPEQGHGYTAELVRRLRSAK